MNASQEIDNRIKELNSWRGERLSDLRRLILEAEPSLKEEWKWKNAAWSLNGLVFAVVAEVSKGGSFVQLTFFEGAALEDPKNLFNAGQDTKAMRYIKFFEGDNLDEQALRELIQAAIAHNKAKA